MDRQDTHPTMAGRIPSLSLSPDVQPFEWFPDSFYDDPPPSGTARPWRRTEIRFAAGHNCPEEEGERMVLEIRLFGPRLNHGELIMTKVCRSYQYTLVLQARNAVPLFICVAHRASTPRRGCRQHHPLQTLDARSPRTRLRFSGVGHSTGQVSWRPRAVHTSVLATQPA